MENEEGERPQKIEHQNKDKPFKNCNQFFSSSGSASAESDVV